MPHRKTIRGPIQGEVLVVEFSEALDPIFRSAENTAGSEINPEMGRILILVNIPENLQLMLDIGESEEVIFAPSDRSQAEDRFMVRQTGKLISVYDFPLADEEKRTRIFVGELLDRLKRDTLLSVLYDNPAALGKQVTDHVHT